MYAVPPPVLERLPERDWLAVFLREVSAGVVHMSLARLAATHERINQLSAEAQAAAQRAGNEAQAQRQRELYLMLGNMASAIEELWDKIRELKANGR